MKINIEKIKSVMESRGMNATELAFRSGKTETWIYHVLRGKGGRSFATVEAIAKALEMNPTELVVD